MNVYSDDFTEETHSAYVSTMRAFLKRFTDHDDESFMCHMVRWATVCKVNGFAQVLEICDAPFMRERENHEEELDKFLLFCDTYPPLKVKPRSRLLAFGKVPFEERTEEDLHAAMMHDLAYGITKKDCM